MDIGLLWYLHHGLLFEDPCALGFPGMLTVFLGLSSCLFTHKTVGVHVDAPRFNRSAVCGPGNLAAWNFSGRSPGQSGNRASATPKPLHLGLLSVNIE